MDKSKNSGKFFLISGLVLVLVVGVFFLGRYIIYTKIKSAIVEELDNLSSQGVTVSYDHIDVHPWTAKIEFFQLNVVVRKGGQPTGLDATIPYVLIKGIQIIPFLKDNTLALREVTAEQAAVTYVKGGFIFNGENTKRDIDLSRILVDRINLPGIDLYINQNAGDTLAHLLSDVSMRDIELQKQLDSLAWKHGEIEVNKFALRIVKSNYAVSAKRALVSIHDRNIALDSFRIQPTLSKSEYMAAEGKQTTYIAGLVPQLRLAQINWFTYPVPGVHIGIADVELQLDMFRDKRYPFQQIDKRELPVHFLQKLPVRLVVDSVRVTNSLVKYEEFPESGDSTGTVYFENLRAIILDVHNNPNRRQSSQMFATADFMGTGLLNASFTFPYDTLLPYRVSGTLENMELASLNNMLGSAARVKAESGKLRNLKFDFSYNDTNSNGNLTLAYEDLRILSLKNKNEEQAVSHLKSLLLNTIFIKKDVFNNISSDDRTGTISFTRDQKKSVFNFWWKSILSGVKSAFYLDKLPGGADTKSKKKSNKVKEVFSKIFANDKK